MQECFAHAADAEEAYHERTQTAIRQMAKQSLYADDLLWRTGSQSAGVCGRKGCAGEA